MVITFTYKPSLVRIDIRNFELTHPQTHILTQIHGQDRFTAPLSLARSVKFFQYLRLAFLLKGPSNFCRSMTDAKTYTAQHLVHTQWNVKVEPHARSNKALSSADSSCNVSRHGPAVSIRRKVWWSEPECQWRIQGIGVGAGGTGG